MAITHDSNAFFADVAAYDEFMGRLATPLAQQFAKLVPLAHGDTVLDVGCGTGALTAELVARVGARGVSAVDPSPPFLGACVRRHPGITGKVGRAEALPFDMHAFDAVLSQLVLPFVEDLARAGKEFIRVVKPGGIVAACTWIPEQVQPVHFLNQAALAAGVTSPPTPASHAFGEPGSLASFLESSGVNDVHETTITIYAKYPGFEQAWSMINSPNAPVAPWMKQQSDRTRVAMKAELFKLAGEPTGAFELSASALAAWGRSPA